MKDQTTGRSETFGAACRHVSRVAAGLARLGLGEGSVVCLWSSNYVEYWLVSTRAVNDPSVSTITEKASKRASSWLKVPTSSYALKTLL